MKRFLAFVIIFLTAGTLVACSKSDMIRPSQKIGPMWVNRYGHSNAAWIWEYCDSSMPDAPGTRTTECSVPHLDEMFIGQGVRGIDEAQRDALWDARTWEMSIDGHAVDLPAFNIVDFGMETESKWYWARTWRIRLREIPEGLHTLRYVMHVNQVVEGDPDAKTTGTYELVVNFTFEK